MDLATVKFGVDGGIARVVLNRPAQLNAISPSLLQDLDRVCDEVERSSAVRAMTLTAAGAPSARAPTSRPCASCRRIP